MSAEAIAIVAVGVTLLVPLMLALNHGLRSEVAACGATCKPLAIAWPAAKAGWMCWRR